MRIALASLLFLTPAVWAAEPSALEAAVKKIADDHKGKVAVAVKNLATGEGFHLNGDTAMPTASLIKVAVLVEAYRQADAKKLDLGKTVTLTKDDKVPGAGILTPHFSDGATFPVRDAVRLMIVYSDNTATNLVLDQVGIQNVNDTTKAFGLPETRVNAKVYRGSTTSVDPARTKTYGLGSTTANEMVKLLESIHAEKAASAEACRAMLGHLKANDDKRQLMRFLPAGTVVAHKTGAVSNARTDAGIIYVPDPADAAKKKTIPVAVCVLTDENEDKRWTDDNAGEVTIGKIGKAVYDRYAK
jgi:beta-lactamase class A